MAAASVAPDDFRAVLSSILEANASQRFTLGLIRDTWRFRREILEIYKDTYHVLPEAFAKYDICRPEIAVKLELLRDETRATLLLTKAARDGIQSMLFSGGSSLLVLLFHPFRFLLGFVLFAQLFSLEPVLNEIGQRDKSARDKLAQIAARVPHLSDALSEAASYDPGSFVRMDWETFRPKSGK